MYITVVHGPERGVQRSRQVLSVSLLRPKFEKACARGRRLLWRGKKPQDPTSGFSDV
jgi:hypothetical protein